MEHTFHFQWTPKVKIVRKIKKIYIEKAENLSKRPKNKEPERCNFDTYPEIQNMRVANYQISAARRLNWREWSSIRQWNQNENWIKKKTEDWIEEMEITDRDCVITVQRFVESQNAKVTVCCCCVFPLAGTWRRTVLRVNMAASFEITVVPCKVYQMHLQSYLLPWNN